MATKKTQQMAEFYRECQKKGYTDMTDDTQSLKAKVIATDMKLKYGDIVSFYEKAEQCHKQIEAEKEEAKRQGEIARLQQQEEAKRRAVSGTLLVEIYDTEDTTNPKATAVRVYIRPDRTIYSTVNKSSHKIEGAPSLAVIKGESVLAQYHPSKAVYTGATVGGITTGGVHYTQDGYSLHTRKTGNADIKVSIGSTSFDVAVVVLSDYAQERFHREKAFSALVKNGRITCRKDVDGSDFNAVLRAGVSSGDYATQMYALGKAADMHRLDSDMCTRIVTFVGSVIHGYFPPTDEEIYAAAENLAKGTTSEQLKRAEETFKKISDYKDAAARARALKKKYGEVLQTEKEQAILAKEAAKKARKKAALIAAVVVVVAVAAAFLCIKVVIPNGKYNDAIALMDAGKYTEAISVFEELDGYKDSATKLQNARELWVVSSYNSIAAGSSYTVGLKLYTTVVVAGAVAGNETDVHSWVRDWRDIVSVAAGSKHIVGLTSYGKVVAVGNGHYGQWKVLDWRDIVAVAAGGVHTVGLKSDGTVVAVGDNDYGQCDVSSWTDIVAVAAGRAHTVGLRLDGTVVATGNNDYGQCDVSGWTNIVAIVAGTEHTVGLRADGTVVAVGLNGDGRCNLGNWTDIVAVSAGQYHTLGLKADGTVVAVGYNENGQCDVSSWTDIVAVAAGGVHTVGLKSDGTVVAVGDNGNGQCEISRWTEIKTP